MRPAAWVLALAGLLGGSPAAVFASLPHPEIASVARLSPEVITPGETLALSYAVETNDTDVERVTFSYARTPTFFGWGPEGTAELSIPQETPGGAYELLTITIGFGAGADVFGEVIYFASGLVYYSLSGETGAHSIDFAALGFSVDAEELGIRHPELASVARLSPELIAPGETLALSYAVETNDTDVERVTFSYRDPANRNRGDFWGWGPQGTAELLIAEDYLGGSYELATISVSFGIDGAVFSEVIYFASGLVYYSLSGETGTHSIDFAALGFSVDAEGADIRHPELASVERISPDRLARGDLLSLGYSVETNGTVVDRVTFSYRDPAARNRGAFWGLGPQGVAELLIAEDYLGGSYELVSISVSFGIDGAAIGEVIYYASGLAYYSLSGETGTHSIDFSQLGFAVSDSYPAFLSTIKLDDRVEQPAVSLTARPFGIPRHFSYIFDPSNGVALVEIPISPEDLVAQISVPDLNGNHSEEIVFLEINQDGFPRARAKDGLTGDLLGAVNFDPDYAPRWMRMVGTAADDSDVVLAVLGISQSGRPRAQVKRLADGGLVSQVFFDPAFDPIGFEVVEDIDGNGHRELVVIGVDAEGRVRAQVKDSVTGALLSMVWFDRRFTPLFVAGLDMSGTGWPDTLVVLGENEAGVFRAQAKTVATGELLGIVRFESGYEVHGLVVLPDLDGSAAPELGVLQRDAEGRVRAQLKDVVTGHPAGTVEFSRMYTPRNLVAVPGAAGPGSAGLAYVGEGSVGSFIVQVRDVMSGRLLSSNELQN